MTKRVTLQDIGQAKHLWLKTADHLPNSANGLLPAKGLFTDMLRQVSRGSLPCQLIAEIKPKSPSAGVLTQPFDLPTLVSAYDRHAQGFSVLTDEPYFNGSFDTLRYVAQHSQKPALCKDFILDRRQIWHARACGAEAVLLIVKLLEQSVLISLITECEKLNLTPVVEIQNRDELDRALMAKATVILINNRDLSSFVMDMDTTPRLLPFIPLNVLVIAASGYGENTDSLRAVAPNVNAVLMGSRLMPLANMPAALDKALVTVTTALNYSRV